MSLFKVRDCWSTVCGRGETFGCDALAVDDLFGAGEDSIILGSLDGVLRVYGVHSAPPSSLQYSPSDLLIEMQLDNPVLQVCTGKLISCSPSKNIAVLHPFSIVVYGVNCIAGSTDHGDQYVLETMYEHKFDRSAYQMVVGPFGGGSGSRDFACIMSLDGVVTVYEQQAFGFRTTLPNYLHPFPIKYVRSVDAFITLNADLCLVCYKYQELADPSLKQKCPVWSCTLGETVYDIQTVEITPSATTIHVLGERNYYCFQGNGVLWFMKRLQYTPCCFHPYILGEHPDTKTMCMIVSDTDSVLVYDQTKLRWSAKLSFHPCIIARASFKALQGCLVLLSETGDLRFCYLGTEPMIFMAPERPIKDYKDTKNQLVQLKKELQNMSLQDETDTLPLLKLSTRILNLRSEGSGKLCDIEIDVSPSLATASVQITFQVDTPLVISPTVVHLKDLNDSITVRVMAHRENEDTESVVSSTECIVCAYYSRTSDVPGLVQQTVRLPMSLVYEVHSTPNLDFSWSAKISVDESPVALKVLFKEFVDSSLAELCFQTITGFSKYVCITALPANRSYEIRSSGPEYANVIIEEILFRHREYYKTKKCVVRCDKNEMPVADFYRTIEEHVALKGKLEFVQEEISSLCSQYRIIQKCLFNKLKENTVHSVSGLNVLIDNTHETLTEKMSEIKFVKQELKVKFSQLMSLSRLLITMLGLCSKNDKILKEFKETIVYFTDNQNWEDIVLKSLTYLVGNKITLNVQSDDPAHAVMSLRTLIDYVIQHITSIKDELPVKLKKETTRGVSPILESEEDFYTIK
ncbi:protein PTHB1 isoform X2 [Aphis craccivora]|uniref:Protein PTHB1 isoform X2 n=1 Tax=Aphis craccivora TaxID=307492 RepID=A0A6G0YMA2_APHCR|nr:protein PTHB1 isoform X2 [Aphis craccivora]